MARKKSSGRPSDYEWKSLKLAGSDRPASPDPHPQHRPRFGCCHRPSQQLQDLYDQEDAQAAAAELEAQRMESEMELEAANDVLEPILRSDRSCRR